MSPLTETTINILLLSLSSITLLLYCIEIPPGALQLPAITTTFLCSLRVSAMAMNNLILSTLISPELQENVSIAVDCGNGQRIKRGIASKVFKRGTNFPETATCIVGANVMFLTNSMLDKGVSNGTCGIITHVRDDSKVDVALACYILAYYNLAYYNQKNPYPTTTVLRDGRNGEERENVRWS